MSQHTPVGLINHLCCSGVDQYLNLTKMSIDNEDCERYCFACVSSKKQTRKLKILYIFFWLIVQLIFTCGSNSINNDVYLSISVSIYLSVLPKNL